MFNVTYLIPCSLTLSSLALLSTILFEHNPLYTLLSLHSSPHSSLHTPLHHQQVCLFVLPSPRAASSATMAESWSTHRTQSSATPCTSWLLITANVSICFAFCAALCFICLYSFDFWVSCGCFVMSLSVVLFLLPIHPFPTFTFTFASTNIIIPTHHPAPAPQTRWPW